jgi:predicted HicB family RNase H-like nuclease
MPNKNPTRKILHLHIDEHVHDIATETANREGVTVTALIQAMIAHNPPGEVVIDAARRIDAERRKR